MRVLFTALILSSSLSASATIELVAVRQAQDWRFTRLAREVQQRTSLTLATTLTLREGGNFNTVPWLWVRDLTFVADDIAIAQWIRKGGMLVVEGGAAETLTAFTVRTFGAGTGAWQNISLEHELMRSFYLLDALPACDRRRWRGFTFAGRLAIVVMPHRLLAYLRDKGEDVPCLRQIGKERATRLLVNLLMVALAGDYKKDQVHLPEILKRLR